MADHTVPDYELEPQLEFETTKQYKALFEDTRLHIVDLLLERAATISELADTLDKPKGTVGHHVSVLEEAGLIRVVRTKMVRAIEAKYYGRTARVYVIGDEHLVGASPGEPFLTIAAAEYGVARRSGDIGHFSTLRYARIPDERAAEWATRLGDLAQEFASMERGGETTFGLVIAMYPTDRPHLPEQERER
jgi:DNA-binding transcriptional ArsR family regulator